MQEGDGEGRCREVKGQGVVWRCRAVQEVHGGAQRSRRWREGVGGVRRCGVLKEVQGRVERCSDVNEGQAGVGGGVRRCREAKKVQGGGGAGRCREVKEVQGGVGACGDAKGAHRALCVRCAKSRLFSTTGSPGSQGSESCILQPLLVHQCLPRVPGS